MIRSICSIKATGPGLSLRPGITNKRPKETTYFNSYSRAYSFLYYFQNCLLSFLRLVLYFSFQHFHSQTNVILDIKLYSYIYMTIYCVYFYNYYNKNRFNNLRLMAENVTYYYTRLHYCIIMHYYNGINPMLRLQKHIWLFGRTNIDAGRTDRKHLLHLSRL